MANPISAERLSYLVGLIYDCAIDPGQWPVAMEAIRTELDFHNATLDLILLPSREALSSVQCNIPPQYAALMDGAGPDVVEQWGGEEVARTLPLDRPAVLSRVNPAFDFETTTNGYFLAFAKPQGITDVLAIVLARDARAIGTVSFGRHLGAGPIGDREIAVAHLLVPHLQRAATINRMLDGAALAQTTFATTLDRLAVPILLLDAERRLVHANPAAERLLARGVVVRLAEGIVDAATPGAANALAMAIRQAARDESAIGRQGLGIPVSGVDGSVGALHVLPLRGNRRRIDHGVVAAVFAARHILRSSPRPSSRRPCSILPKPRRECSDIWSPGIRRRRRQPRSALVEVPSRPILRDCTARLASTVRAISSGSPHRWLYPL